MCGHTKKNRNFVFFFKFVTNWWMNLHFHMILNHEKPIVHDVLPEETQVQTQYVKFKVTRDKMVTFAFNFGQ